MNRTLYDILFWLVLIVTSPVWGLKLLSTGKWKTDWAARFGKTEFKPDGRPVLLIHCVSVGETNAVRQMVDHIDQLSQGKLRIVISVTTDTGIARARQLFEPRHTVVRYPMDVGFAVRRFLDAINPCTVALTELEVWPNFVRECSERKIPVSVINGRLSERSYRRYLWVRGFMAQSFSKLHTVSAQTPEYADRFIGLGADPARVHVGDTMKWDTAQIANEVPGSRELAREMGIEISPFKPLIVAGSIAPDEVDLIVKSCPPNALLLMAPRKPELFSNIEKKLPGIVRRTKHPAGTVRPIDGSRYFLLDTIGELRKAYALANVVLVGRSFLGLHGSDMMEPIALGKPTIIGPHYSDFKSMTEALLQGGGIIVSADPAEPIRKILSDGAEALRLSEAGRDVIYSRQGASLRNANMLLEITGVLQPSIDELIPTVPPIQEEELIPTPATIEPVDEMPPAQPPPQATAGTASPQTTRPGPTPIVTPASNPATPRKLVLREILMPPDDSKPN